MSDYKLTIGLEIHAELKTKTKMFCGCLNAPDSTKPNIYICPICLGYPGTLPVINKEAVKKVLMVGLSVNGELADFTEFDRKNYFYPDIPKGYQISQYKHPLVSGGQLAGISLTRIHLEEDTAKSSHSEANLNSDKDSQVQEFSLVDFNRAGVPLMELVTEPVIHSEEEASNFGKELQTLLQYLEVSDANMEMGQMRIEANISVSNTDVFGTKVEVKNINSFKAVFKAVEYEFERQKGLLERGEKVLQETRGFDDTRGVTFSQRSKENAHDYRYFPDPDLPKLLLSEIDDFKHDVLKSNLPELPSQKRERYLKYFGLKMEDIETYVSNKVFSQFFEAVAHEMGELKSFLQIASNYITSDLIGLSKSFNISIDKISPKAFADLIKMLVDNKISSRGAKDILKVLFTEGGEPSTIAIQNNLLQKNDEESLKSIMEKIISDNPNVVKDFKSGKESTIQFFVGQGMKETKGSGNPEVLKNITLGLLK